MTLEDCLSLKYCPRVSFFFLFFFCSTGLRTVSGKWPNLAAAQLILSRRPGPPLALHVSIYCRSINAPATTTWYHPLIFSQRTLADAITAVDVRTRRCIKECHASAAVSGGDSVCTESVCSAAVSFVVTTPLPPQSVLFLSAVWAIVSY